MAQLTISEARKVLLDLPEKLERGSGRAITITRRGRPVLAVMPWEFYESLIETLDILGDPDTVSALRDSLEDLKRGRVISNREAKTRLGAMQSGGGDPLLRASGMIDGLPTDLSTRRETRARRPRKTVRR
jgi:prevent-host-death family protein